MRAAGSQMWVTPAGFRTSTRVVTSKLRQPVEAVSAKSEADFVTARPAQTAPLDCRKCRRFINSPRKLMGRPESRFFLVSDSGAKTAPGVSESRIQVKGRMD